MISLMYPSGNKLDLEDAGIIYLDYQYPAKYNVLVNGRSIAVDLQHYKFYVNMHGVPNFNGSRPNLFVTESLNYDTLIQRSNRYDYLNLFDTVNSSNLPVLSTGKVEQPCHHESATGTISINPDVSQKDYFLERDKLYPMSISVSDHKRIGWDGRRSHLTTVSGVALGRVSSVTASDGWSSGPFLAPFCWVTMNSVHYSWPRNNLTFEEANKLGIVTSDFITCTPSYISSSYLPTIYFSDASPWLNGRIMMYGSILGGAYYTSLSGYSAGSSFNLPNVDSLKLRLSRDLPSLFARVNAKIKYPDEIWYNLILAGAKEIKRLDMNNIANLLEIPGMIRAFDKIYKKFISIKSGNKVYSNPTTGAIIKKASCIYLGIHYGIKLTVLDLQEIVKTFRDNPSLLRQLRRRAVSYSHVSVDGTQYNCKSCMSPKAGREITDIRDFSRILGLELSTLNLWDLVPWSFVIDWFIPISDVLDSFENIARLESTYDLEYLMETVSRSESITWEGYSLQIKVYDRYITDHMPEFGFTVGDASGLNNHVIEASALIINSV